MDKNFRFRYVAVAVFSICFCIVCEDRCAQGQLRENLHSTGADNNATILLLKNGSVIQGAITKTADGFAVRTAAGSRIVIQNSLVRGSYGSISEVFQHKFLDALDSDDALSRHRNLFYWTLSVRRPDLARVMVGEIFKEANDANEKRRLLAQVADTENKIEAAKTQYNKVDSQVKQVSWESESDSNALPASDVGRQNRTAIVHPAARNAYRISNAELERSVRKLPNGSIKAFRKTQSKIVSGCTATKCHTEENRPFFLLGSANTDFPKLFTRINIHEVLRHVDKNDPDNSKFLQMLVSKHGDMKQAAFEEGSEFHRQMRYWVFYSTGNEGLWYQEQIAKEQEKLIKQQNEAAMQMKSTDLEGEVLGKKDGRPKPFDPTMLTPPSAEDLLPGNKKRPPKDPFDPQIFNRRFGTKPKTRKLR